MLSFSFNSYLFFLHRILAIISHMASILNITNASSPVVKIHTYFAVSIHETNFGDFHGKMLTINLTDSYNVSLKTERNIVSSTGSVTLPSSNFNSSSINRITNIVYLTDSLFLRHRFNYFKVISDVISTSILREFDAIIELESPVNLSFQLNSVRFIKNAIISVIIITIYLIGYQWLIPSMCFLGSIFKQ